MKTLRVMTMSKNHVTFFHLKIFNPSKGPKGIKLKKARKALIYAIKKETSFK
jgi:ABC-type transport system substrate-binding protein